MQLTLIKNTDESKIILYKLSRIIYAETNGSSLVAAEALASMINNLSVKSQRNFSDIVKDKNIFNSLNKNSVRHQNLLVDSDNKQFQMCLRVVIRMVHGDLPDLCSGAVKFHHIDNIPKRATDQGYITEIDNLLFYL